MITVTTDFKQDCSGGAQPWEPGERNWLEKESSLSAQSDPHTSRITGLNLSLAIKVKSC